MGGAKKASAARESYINLLFFKTDISLLEGKTGKGSIDMRGKLFFQIIDELSKVRPFLFGAAFQSLHQLLHSTLFSQIAHL